MGGAMQGIAKTYPQYDSLWHLVTMGVLTADHRPNGWSAPVSGRRTRVAIIDTSVAAEHPNLVGAVSKDLAFDLFSARLGSFPGRDGAAHLGPMRLGDAKPLVQGLPHAADLLAELTQRLAAHQPGHHKGIAPATSAVFSSHGTAIAGVVGAQPVSIPADSAHIATSDGRLALPYCGVDPFCEIVPISTHFDADPESLILAFLYADLIGADVVLLPRVVPDPLRTVPELSSYVQDESEDTTLTEAVAQTPLSATTREQWDELLELIVRLSLRRPVVCAAGNAHEEFGVYPANFASDENGIIAVGAVNAKGWACSYSPPRNLTIWAPSSDAERFDRGEIRLDSRDPEYDPEEVPHANANHKYSHYDIISTDVPGDGGYAVSPFDGPDPVMGQSLREFGSYFCRFGGTSAASALVAGYLSLAQSTGRLGKGSGGLDTKAWLLANSKPLGADRDGLLVPCWAEEPTFPDQG